ncbi:predicted protein [Cyanophage PSS2]|uniref:hypothetical protein n=1 Tax=Cyanophage PSS2 TaxID=658401 RepID=UPI0001B04009|nr:hypothetical protein PSS2_gp052 [Cyanophage PSS2]ACT65614.1 hypothetical protein [Cyanophage PSS2]ACY75756.1 predicted protein [Cyanophage PSS2]
MNTNITLKNTKAEIFAAYTEQAEMNTQVTWDQLRAKAEADAEGFIKEFKAAVAATFDAGQTTRRWFDAFQAEMTQPIFKA